MKTINITVPVIDLAQAHALKAVGTAGANVSNYAIDSTLRPLPPSLVVRSLPCPGKLVGAPGGKIYARYATTRLGMRAVKLAFDRAEGRW